MMNEYIGNDVTEKLHEEQWLTQLQATAHGGTERAAGRSSSDSKQSGGGKEIKAEIAAGHAAAAAADVAGADGPGNRRRLAAVWQRVTKKLRDVW